jgi:hypothetical protein
MVRPAGIEPTTHCLEGSCSIQLSYERNRCEYNLHIGTSNPLGFLILLAMDAQKKQLWQKSPYANLIRYVPSKTYYARIRVRGKLLRKSLEMDRISVAKLRWDDLEKTERQAGESTVGSKRQHDGGRAGRLFHLQSPAASASFHLMSKAATMETAECEGVYLVEVKRVLKRLANERLGYGRRRPERPGILAVVKTILRGA